MYIECSQLATFLHMNAWMLLYIGDEMCHVSYMYENRSGLLLVDLDFGLIMVSDE